VRGARVLPRADAEVAIGAPIERIREAQGRPMLDTGL
jgi:hypothetical protein